MIDAAIRYLEAGLAPIPLLYGQKTPVGKWQELEVTRNNVRELFSGKRNIGLKCRESGIVVVDYDKPEGLEYGKKTCKETGVIVETGSGKEQHYYLNNGAIESSIMNFRKLGIDVIVNGYVTAPPSVHPCGGVYRFKAFGVMTQFNPAWFPRSEYRQVQLASGSEPEGQLRFRLQRFAKKRPAKEGQRDLTAWSIACFAVQALGMRPEAALEELRAWNEYLCTPPLSESKLRWKVQEALRLKHRSHR
jgi:hypothetical protein